MLKPLEGIRVCDTAQNLAGPYCSQILGDLGADVIKVEPPGGDSARPWGPPFWGSDSALFLSVNRNKRSIVLDLKSEEGMEALRRLVRTSDVFLQASRMGVAERLGFDYPTLREINPRLVYLAVTAFGDRGPMKNSPGYDPLIQAFSGIMSLTGHPDGPPARVGGSVVDFGTGMWGAIGILAALRQREITGEGSQVDVALLDTALGWISYHLLGYLSTGEVPGRMGSGLASIVPYEGFPTSDGEVMIAGGSDPIFRRLCQALGIPEIADQPDFATNPARVAHRGRLVPLLATRTSRMTTAELMAKLQAHAVPSSPVRSVDEVVEDAQVQASGMIAEQPHPQVEGYRDVSLPFRLSGERPRGERAVPRPGQDTREILAELDYDDAAIDRLVQSGIATTGEP